MAADRSRIVVGVDGSEPSRQALRWARSLARAFDAEIEAVTAWTFPTVGAGAPNWPDDWDPAADAAQVLHEAVVATLGEHPDTPVHERVVEGGAARTLLEISSGARMLVVGSRGHGGFSALLLGSVSAACAEYAAGAVLVVHGDTPPPP
jgi:nucleotide-binding universal stress UspA family protein